MKGIRTGACLIAVACALAACTQPAPYGAQGAPPAPPDGHASPPGTTMPDANTRNEPRPSPGNLMPQDAAGGEPADVPPPGPNGMQGDQPMPGTPPPMQY
jgi:hypothetical protein